MISNFRLKFGRAADLPAEPVSATPVTVFVGPNNSGKSKVLAEIAQYCKSGQKNATAVILEDLAFAGLATDRATQAIEHIKLPPNLGEALNVGHIFVGARGGRQQVPLQNLTQFIENPSTNIQAFCQWFLQYRTLMLDGRSRIDLVNQQAGGDLQQPPQSSLQVLFRTTRSGTKPGELLVRRLARISSLTPLI